MAPQNQYTLRLTSYHMEMVRINIFESYLIWYCVLSGIKPNWVVQFNSQREQFEEEY